MSDSVGELLQPLVVPALAPVAWLLVVLALLEMFGFGMLNFQFSRVLLRCAPLESVI